MQILTCNQSHETRAQWNVSQDPLAVPEFRAKSRVHPMKGPPDVALRSALVVAQQLKSDKQNL